MVIDDTTVASVMFDGVVASGWTRVAGTNTLTGPIPSGTGTVEVTVSLNGGNSASAGNFTYVVTPPPPPTPALAPGDVMAMAGDEAATVSWTAPASSGSYAVSNYLATSSPGGRTCLVAAPVLTCDVTRLTNGTAYTFTVKALTGAGWSASSEPSNAVTPEAEPSPTITITGSRDGDRAVVSGATTGFGMGGELTPWFRLAGKDSFRQGTKTILVSTEGTFEWSRRARSQINVYIATPDGSVRSNVVTIRGR